MNSKKNSTKNHDSKSIIMDFGNRKVSQQNFSKIVALPKTALNNCGITSYVNVKLIQSKDEKFIRLTPVENKGDVTNE
jgi:hypothetical protein